MEIKVRIMSHEGSLNTTAQHSQTCFSGTLPEGGTGTSDRLWFNLSISLVAPILLGWTSDYWLLVLSQSLPEATYLR